MSIFRWKVSLVQVQLNLSKGFINLFLSLDGALSVCIGGQLQILDNMTNNSLALLCFKLIFEFEILLGHFRAKFSLVFI